MAVRVSWRLVLAVGCVAALTVAVQARAQEARPSGVAESAAASGQPSLATPEDTRTQFPSFMANSFFSVNLGHLDYRFSNRQLEPGFGGAAVSVPHLGAQVILFGHEFNRHLSVESIYMRPARWVSYHHVNGEAGSHSVWMTVGGVALKPRLPVTRHVSLFAEGGIGVVSRHGFDIDGRPAVGDSVFASALIGGGAEYHVDSRWDLTTGILVAPGNTTSRQPAVRMVSTGFRYTMRQLSAERIEANGSGGVVFPERQVHVEYTTRALGYGVNDFMSSKVPIFWNGNAEVARGLALHYTRNVFHTRRVFSFDLGGGVSSWESKARHETFFTGSLYPLMRFTVLRTAPADFYFSYSLAGPTYISRSDIDGHDTGSHFTFQDFIGVGAFLGGQRRVSMQVKITHYSNGNFVTDNAAVKVPVTFSLGYGF